MIIRHDCTRYMQLQTTRTQIYKKVMDLQEIAPGDIYGWFQIYFHLNSGLAVYGANQVQHKARIKQLTKACDDYFDLRLNLFKELIRKGFRRISSVRTATVNYLAVNSVIMQCQDLLFFCRGDYDLILSTLYLLAGRLQESHDLSCYLARKGTIRLGDHKTDPIRKNCVTHHDITQLYLKVDAWDGSSARVKFDPCHWAALCNMYLIKYILHLETKDFLLINTHFLDNQDCIELIGEYAGLKKYWPVLDGTSYLDQVVEALHIFHCQELHF